MAIGDKRILIVSQYFYPENFKISELAFEMKNRGYDVDVLTGIPNYPEGSYKKGYGIFHKRIETVNGVKIYRAFNTPRGKSASALGLALNYMSFLFSAYLWILFFFIFKKYDIIFAFQLSPLTSVLPGVLLKKLRRTKLYTWVLDIWPDSVVSTIGQKKSAPILSFLNYITDCVYRNSDKILISSEKFKELVNRNADYSEKIIYFPNWCDDILAMPEQEIPQLPQGFIIMMAGNLADGIGVSEVENLVEELKDIPEIKFVFVGGGAKMHEMQEFFTKEKLINAYVMGAFPFACMSSFYNKADAMLLSLKPTTLLHLNATVPARLQSYMSSGKPVFAMIGEGAAKIIKDSNCGFVVPAGDYKQLAQTIRSNYQNQKLLDSMGQNGRKTYELDFTLRHCIDNLENILH